MPQQQDLIIFVVLLSIIILLGACCIFYVLKKQKKDEIRAFYLTANDIRNAFESIQNTSSFIFSVVQKPNSFMNTHFLIRDEHDQTVGIIRFPRTQYPLIRTIEYNGEIYECVAALAVLDNRVSLKRQGSSDEPLCFEPKLTNEFYTRNGQAIYIRELFALSANEGWAYTSGGEKVAYLKNMNNILKLNGKVFAVLGAIPMIEQLFIIAMSHHLNGTQ